MSFEKRKKNIFSIYNKTLMVVVIFFYLFGKSIWKIKSDDQLVFGKNVFFNVIIILSNFCYVSTFNYKD